MKNQTKTINFAANEFSATVYFTLMNDNLSEQDEVFQVQFVDDQNINIGAPSEAELTILGDCKLKFYKLLCKVTLYFLILLHTSSYSFNSTNYSWWW